MSASTVSRRDFLRVSALLAAGSLAAACVPPPEPSGPVAAEPTAAPVDAAPSPKGLKEAPMLQELVKAGKLPPLEERLPEDPLICTPI